MKLQINFWFLRNHDRTIYGNDNISKFFLSGRRRWDEFKRFFCMYDPHTDTKSDAAKYSLLRVCRILQPLQIKFELYWYSAQDLIIDKKNIGFQGRHKDKIHITSKDAGDGLQDDDVCDCGCTHSFIY